MDKAGDGLSVAGKRASMALHGNASRAGDAVRNAIVGTGPVNGWRRAAGGLGWIAAKALTHTAGLAADTVNVVGKASTLAGRITERSAPALGGAVGGVVRGAAEMASNAVDAAALSGTRIEAMRVQLRELGQVELKRSESRLAAVKSAQKRRRKDELLDLLVVGGVTLAQVLRDPGSVPAEVQQAFVLAYPGLAQNESFSDAVERMSSDGLVGLVSGVKGKLFELELVDHLNSGGLPDGFTASMASSATQPGWDIQIRDAQGEISELLQAKATESAQYVQEALNRYPDIDVTTTTEVHAQLLAMGLAQDVHNSGISETVLQAKVEAASQAGGAFDASNLVPSSLGLAVIALSVFMNKGDTTLREKGAAFGSRSAKAGGSSAVGKLAMVATQTWWLGLIAGVGSSWLASHGQGKREQYEALRGALAVMKTREKLVYNDKSLIAASLRLQK
ncbi:hypothetical protein RA876_14280 [Rhodoferax antarcticus]|nr:hypothetical protein RA876_14280 [Rhodoferax antarcticus]